MNFKKKLAVIVGAALIVFNISCYTPSQPSISIIAKRDKTTVNNNHVMIEMFYILF